MLWSSIELSAIADIIMGQSPPGTTYNEEGQGLPFFQGKAEFGSEYPEIKKWCSAPTRVAKKDDILLSVRAPVGPTNIASCECCIGRGLAAIRSKGEKIVNQRYLWFYLKKIESTLSKQGQGSTFNAINRSEINKLTLSLPPISEQKRIVEILNQAYALRKKRAEADAKIERILPALFYKMFGNPIVNLLNWPIKSINSLCEIVTGNTPSTKIKKYYGDSVPWARPADLNGKILVKKTESNLSKDGSKVARMVPPNSVLVVCIGATLGRVALAGVDMAINQQINAIMPCSNLLPEFLYMQCVLMADSFRSAATKSTLQIINKSRFGQQRIIVPPIDKQQIFSKVARELIESEPLRKLSHNKLDVLFNSLLHRAFSGDLTAKWREAHMKEILIEMEEQAKAIK